jgi:hypothetical protein
MTIEANNLSDEQIDADTNLSPQEKKLQKEKNEEAAKKSGKNSKNSLDYTTFINE